MNFVLAHSVCAISGKMLPEMQRIRNVIRVTNVVPKNSTLLNKAHSKFPVISSFGADRPET